MLNSYKDACSLNEAHVFYATSTNTFRNPLFEPAIGLELADELNELGPHDNNCRPEVSSQLQRQAAAESNDAPTTEPSQAGAAAAAGERPGVRKSLSNNMSFSSQGSELGARWQEFCDSLSLSIKGRLFIMESNLKRRLRAMRKYLGKRAPWLLAHNPSRVAKQQQQQQLDGDLAGHRLQGFGRFQFPEPRSSKSLDAQQECLLNRLERIKRQRLFASLSPDTSDSSSSSRDSEDAANDNDDDGEGEARAPPPPSSQGQEGAGGSGSMGQDEGRAVGLGPPLLVEQPLGLFAAIGPQAAAGRAKAKSKLKLGHALGERSRWISRSGRHIRDTALAFASSKKSCIVCYERPANIVTLPCKHSDICSECFIEIIYMAVKQSQYPLKCVLCRQKVERIRCSRRLLLSVIEKNRARC